MWQTGKDSLDPAQIRPAGIGFIHATHYTS